MSKMEFIDESDYREAMQEEIDSLRQQLAEKDKEIERLQGVTFKDIPDGMMERLNDAGKNWMLMNGIAVGQLLRKYGTAQKRIKELEA